MLVADNLLKIKQTLPPDVTLVAVSKFKPAEMILEAYEAGQRDFGENYVQELVDKSEQLPKDIRWHFIGHLQSNKVKYIAPFVHLIQGVDSYKLLLEINKQAQKNNRVINCLLQLHIAVEETKFGLSLDECREIFKSGALNELKHVNVCGLMAMASNTADEAHVRGEYQVLNLFRLDLMADGYPLNTASYGMSGDYHLAIACGSNMVRIGSSIFGERH
ncbi:MAG: YggS family pyridoxal phosphate-dependent enzyme [Bacteroidia bacterium]|nr:YggS family pyridoxal phosphate-dependent enzyme [Bacteroidia bacterium]